jgi:nucleotide-binding universal stress UspA family protein
MGLSNLPPPSSIPSRVVVLAAVDASAFAERIANVTASLATRIGGSELHFVHVIEHLPTPDDLIASKPTATELLERGREHLEDIGRAARAHFAGRIVVHLAAGTAWREVLQMAADLHADLILVGTHDRKGIQRVVLGSVSEQIVRKASCPVLVVRPKDYHANASPYVDPPCSDCVATQHASAGKIFWCERHREHHPHGRLHYELPEPFAVGSMLIRP